jgi:hypothetical protein
VSNPEQYQIQFDQAFDGAYRYLDRCGEFMAKAREEFGFVPLSVNPSGCTMESPDIALQLQASGDAVVLTCTNPKHADNLLAVANFCSETALELFEPFAIEHYRLVSRSVWRTATLEEAFKNSLRITSSSIENFAGLFQMPALNQELLFSFESGSRRVHLRLSPISFNVTAAERKLPLLGTPKGFRDYLIKKERSIQQNPAQPGYGVGLEIAVLEIEPAPTGSIDKLYQILLDYNKRVLEHLDQ